VRRTVEWYRAHRGAGALSAAAVEPRANEHAAAPVGKARFIAGDPIRALCCTASWPTTRRWRTAIASAAARTGHFSHNYGTLGIRIHALNVVVWFFFSLSAFLISRPSWRRSPTTAASQPEQLRAQPAAAHRPAFWARSRCR